MKKVRKTMLPKTKMPQHTRPGGGQKFRVHAKGVGGHKGAMKDGGYSPVVPVGGSKTMPTDEHPMKRGSTKSKMPTPKSDKALLMRTKMH